MRAISYLQDVVVIESGCDRDFLCNDHRILKKFIRDIVKLLPVPCRGSSKDDANDRYIKRTLRDHEGMPASEGIDVQEGEACGGGKRPGIPQRAVDRLTISRSR